MCKWLSILCLCAPQNKLDGEDGFVTQLMEMCDDDTDEVPPPPPQTAHHNHYSSLRSGYPP